MTVSDVRSAPTRELGTASLYPIPSWGKLTASAVIQPLEHVPELLWPISVRETYPRMRNDSQLSGLYRGTALPIMRYVWGIDPNGADPDVVERVCAELGLETIDEAWKTFQTGQSAPVKRQRHSFRFSELIAEALKAAYLGSYMFEQVYDVEQDGDPAVNAGWFAHLSKLAPRAPWTISQFYIDPDGSLTGIRQTWQRLGDPPIPASQLVAFVFDQDPGDWVGNSLFRPCYREWLSKDLLYRIDTVNHEKAGGILINEAPPGALQSQIDALGEMAQNVRAGGGGSVPDGTNPIFLRATGSDVIASINQRDEAMARAFLMMFMSLGTASSGGNRALSQSFVDWFSISQEAIAIWFRDVVNEQVIKDFVDLNWDGQDYLPLLKFKRPEDANPLDDLAEIASDGGTAGQPAALASRGGEVYAHGRVGGKTGAVVLEQEILEELRLAHLERRRDIEPMRNKPIASSSPVMRSKAMRTEVAPRSRFEEGYPSESEREDAAVERGWALRAARLANGYTEGDLAARAHSNVLTVRRAESWRSAATVTESTWARLEAAASGVVLPFSTLPDRPLRRQPTEMEIRAQVNFKQIDEHWQSAVDQLVADWQAVKASQISQLQALIEEADGDLSTLAQMKAIAAGGDVITAHLQTMAAVGVAEAVSEANAQGGTALTPDLEVAEAQLAARANAMAQLLASTLSQAAATKAIQLTGGALTAEDVAAQVGDYLDGLSDTYLNDQFGGALSAAQNTGRLAAMTHNQASRFYASELLDVNTCQPCEDVDGTEYATAEDAAADYPAGGYRDCAGGPRCRGTVVAIYDEAEATS